MATTKYDNITRKFNAGRKITRFAIDTQGLYIHYSNTCSSYATKKTPPPILYIKAPTVDEEYIVLGSCFTKLYHELIRSGAGYSTQD